MQFGYDEKDACGLEVLVGKAICPQKLGSAHLEIDGVDTVVDPACLVGLVVAGLDGYRAILNRCFFGKIHYLTTDYTDFADFY